MFYEKLRFKYNCLFILILSFGRTWNRPLCIIALLLSYSFSLLPQKTTIPDNLWVEISGITWTKFTNETVNSGFHGKLDLSTLPAKPIHLNQFKELSQKPDSFTLELNSCRQTKFSIENAPSQALKFTTCILGDPEITKTTLPQMNIGATGPVLLFNKDQGITTDNKVNCMVQDKLGRLWIGTSRGLSVYDGEQSYSYLTKQGLSENRIWSLAIDTAGLIWVGTFFGLDVIDPKSNTISHVNSTGWLANNYGHSLLADSNGQVWVGTVRGIFQINKASKSIYRISKNEGLISSVARNLTMDSEGRIWSGHDIGISIIDIRNETIFKIGLEEGITSSRVSCIEQKNKSSFYFGSNNGTYLWDIQESKVYLYSQKTGFPDNDIRSIKINHEGIVFIGTRNKGIIVFNDRNQTFKTIWRQEGLSGDYVPFQFFDSERQHWVGGFNGLHLINNALGNLSRIGVEGGVRDQNNNALMETQDGSIWIAGNSGIDIFNPNNKTVTYVNPSDFYSKTGSNSLFQNSSGIIFIGTFGSGVSILNPKENSLIHLGQRQGLGNYGTSFFLEDNSRRVWIGTQSGINRFNPIDSTLELADKESGLPGHSFISGFAAKDGDIWLSGNSGVFRYELSTEKWFQLNFMNEVPNKRVNEISQDVYGRIWLGSDEDGIYVYDTNKVLLHISKDDGLPQTQILSFNPTGKSMYVTTVKSLTVIDLFDFSLKNYDKTQGLSSTDFQIGSKLRTINNQLWWGIVDGICILEPKEIFHNVNLTSITSIEINGVQQNFKRVLNSATKGIAFDTLWNTALDTFYTSSTLPIVTFPLVKSWTNLQPPYFIPSALTLEYSSNVIRFYFTGMQINEPNHVRYKYMLEGVDKDWSEFTQINSVEYRNLSPGDYIFKVTSCGISDGCGRPSEVRVTILPPFYRTFWFYGLCILALVTFIYFYNRYRVNLFNIQTQLLENEVALRTNEFKEQKERAEKSEEFKQQFLSNMSHEIRTPMNAVIGLVNILLDLNPTKSQMEYLNVIKRSSENLLVILNDILDLGKIEAGKMELEHIDISLQELLDLVYQTLHFKADSKGIELRIKYDNRIPLVLMGDPTRLNQVIVNLVGNAIKFTERGTVSMGAKLMEDLGDSVKVQFCVKDTGIGMTQEQLHRIFKNFTQATGDTTRKYGGTGLGLSISKHLVQLFGGEIQVESKLGKGSEFRFTVNLEKSKNETVQAKRKNFTKSMADEISGLKILVVEDNEYNRLVAKDTLKIKIPDVQLFEAVNGLEAVELVKNQTFDLILMDMHMPEMDGMEAVREIRKFNVNIPIVAFTASVVKKDIDKYSLAGMNGFVPKPFRTNELLIGIYNAYNQEEFSVPLKRNTSGKNSSEVTDLNFLKNFVEDDTEKLRMYIQMYLKNINEIISKIQLNKNNQQYDNIKTLVHSIRPQLKYMGMDQTSVIASEIESQIDLADYNDELDRMIQQLINDCIKSKTELNKELKSL